jgi:hypothetical protein
MRHRRLTEKYILIAFLVINSSCQMKQPLPSLSVRDIREVMPYLPTEFDILAAKHHDNTHSHFVLRLRPQDETLFGTPDVEIDSGCVVELILRTANYTFAAPRATAKGFIFRDSNPKLKEVRIHTVTDGNSLIAECEIYYAK